jgi:hypothetical protein
VVYRLAHLLSLGPARLTIATPSTLPPAGRRCQAASGTTIALPFSLLDSARIRNRICTSVALSVKLTGCPGFVSILIISPRRSYLD